MNGFDVIQRPPTEPEYNTLRKQVGWHPIPSDRANIGLDASLFAVCIEKQGKLVAFGRVVGDGHIYFYIQDVIVHPEYQHHGIGNLIMEQLMAYIEQKAPKKSGAFIGLMIAPGLEHFYGKYGFHPFPENSPALCMWRNGH